MAAVQVVVALAAVAVLSACHRTPTGGCWLIQPDVPSAGLESRYHYPRCPARPDADTLLFEGQRLRVQWEYR